MSAPQKTLATLLSLLLVATLWGLWSTGQEPAKVQGAKAAAADTPANPLPVIDETTLFTAHRLARLATTPEEQPYAQAAVQLADHELDLAFSGALRRLEAHPPVLSPEALQFQQRLTEAQKQVTVDSEALTRLKAKLAQAPDADKVALQDQLELAQMQLELSQDQVEEAGNDLLHAGGNVHQRIKLAQEEHATAERNAAAEGPVAKTSAFAALHGMVAQVRQWIALHQKRGWLNEARADASASAAKLLQQRQALVEDIASIKQHLPADAAHRDPATVVEPLPAPATPAPPAGAATPAAAPAEPTTILSLTRRLAADQRRLTLRDQRTSARQKLADVYTKWDGVVGTQQRSILHTCLQDAAIVLAALLLLLFADRWLTGLLGRARIDRRQLSTLRSVIGVTLQVIAVLVILFVLVGMPGQIGTMLGIAGAGLTVALKDFIVAFIGWFVLMGRNGIRLGDWVEINGVSGEVVELGMFHTVLLETGNWTDAGHPTGRLVTFTNSFAIERHYFNFSTSGQWLWDELTVVVPFGRDAHAIAEAIQKEVTAATSEGARQAEQEWQIASRGRRGSTLSASPGIAVRPAVGGVEIAVRYVTRASERFALRAKLYQSAVQLLADAPKS